MRVATRHHSLLMLCSFTRKLLAQLDLLRYWKELSFTCQWIPNIVPVTVLPSSMTEPSNFEDVPVNRPGRLCQDDSFVSSVDNSKPRVDPFVFLIRHAVVAGRSCGTFRSLETPDKSTRSTSLAQRAWKA